METVEQIATQLTLAFGETTEEITMLSKATCYEQGAKDGLEYAQRWIPIEKKLPDNSLKANERFSIRLLGKDELGIPSVTRFDYRNNRFVDREIISWRLIDIPK